MQIDYFTESRYTLEQYTYAVLESMGQITVTIRREGDVRESGSVGMFLSLKLFITIENTKPVFI